jgi:hypothetical protein
MPAAQENAVLLMAHKTEWKFFNEAISFIQALPGKVSSRNEEMKPRACPRARSLAIEWFSASVRGGFACHNQPPAGP